MKHFLPFIVSAILPVITLAQVPQKMSFQAVIRNSSNELVVSKVIGMRVSILQGSATGTEVYKETYNPNPSTNSNGLVTIEIGGGVPVTGTFAGINWANGPFFIKTETDPNGGANYTITGTSQLLSVPYAQYAGNVLNNGGKTTIYLTGDLTNTQAQAQIAEEFGSNTQEIRVENCFILSSLDLSKIVKAVDILIADNPQLQNLDLSKLISTSSLNLVNCPKLSNLNLSSLKTVGGFDAFNIRGTGITVLNLSALTTCNTISITDNSLLTGIVCSSLSKVNGYIEMSFNQNLTSININNLTGFTGTSVNFSNNKLPSSQVNTLLNRFVNITPAITDVSLYFDLQNPPAPPTGQGLTDVATLTSRGNFVYTD